MKVDFLDMKREYRMMRAEFDGAIRRVFRRSHYVLGPEGSAFEKEFAAYLGAKFAVSVASGTEAVQLALIACGIGANDEVITAANTCCPTVSAIIACGAKPVLADIDPESYCIDPVSFKKKITRRTKAVVPVHLYGQAADMDEISKICRQRGIAVVEDCAQAHGTVYKGRFAGTLGKAAAFSFYPTKNLGAFGDAGMIVTDSPKVASQCLLLRNYGQKKRYEHLLPGFNSRLDELQAAVLRVKLKKLNAWNERRRFIAGLYSSRIRNGSISVPLEKEYGRHAYHLYVIRCRRRDELRAYLDKKGIMTLLHYPVPIHRQKFYVDRFGRKDSFPVAEKLSKTILSLPLYPYLKDAEAGCVIEALNRFQR